MIRADGVLVEPGVKFLTGRTSLSSLGANIIIPATVEACRAVGIQYEFADTGIAVIGDSTVGTTTGWQLYPGWSMSVAVNHKDAPFYGILSGSSSGEVRWIVLI